MAIARIEAELEERLAELKREDKLLEAQRLAQRTIMNIEMLKEMGFCTGIENYSRHLSLREAGSTPLRSSTSSLMISSLLPTSP